MRFHINSFVKRQTPESPYSHCVGDWRMVEEIVEQHFDKARPGYRDGVLLIDVPEALLPLFRSAVKVVEEGDEFVTTFEPRVPGEEPRRSTRVVAPKAEAKSAFIVLYSSRVLAEDGDNELDPVDGHYEVISINAAPTVEPMPIQPGTLMHNHFGSDGGTATNMSPEEFEAALREAFVWWKDKAMVTGAER